MVGGVLWRWRRRWWGNRSGLFGDSSGLVAMGRWVDGGGASLEAGETAVATALVTRLEPRVVKTSKRQPVTAVVIVGRRGLRWCLWCAAMVYLLVARGQGWGCCRSVVVVTGQTAVAARATSVASWEGRMVGYGT